MRKTGIWLDQKEANIIVLEDIDTQIKTIYSDIETRERFEGEKKQYGRFGEQFLNSEKSKENKISELTQLYFQNISKELIDSDEILIFGPAQTKIKLEKFIENQPNLNSKPKKIETAENMTENQKIAYVKKHFS